jgi:hypothetical protein
MNKQEKKCPDLLYHSTAKSMGPYSPTQKYNCWKSALLVTSLGSSSAPNTYNSIEAPLITLLLIPPPHNFPAWLSAWLPKPLTYSGLLFPFSGFHRTPTFCSAPFYGWSDWSLQKWHNLWQQQSQRPLTGNPVALPCSFEKSGPQTSGSWGIFVWGGQS